MDCSYYFISLRLAFGDDDDDRFIKFSSSSAGAGFLLFDVHFLHAVVVGK